MSYMETNKNPLLVIEKNALAEAQKRVSGFVEIWAKHENAPPKVPLGDFLESNVENTQTPWVEAGDASNLLSLQYVGLDGSWSGHDRAIRELWRIIGEPIDGTSGHYRLAQLPPNHWLLNPFELGSTHWFRVLYDLTGIKNIEEEVEGWGRFASDLFDWIVMWDRLQIDGRIVLDAALDVNWVTKEYMLPEMIQNPVWSFPQAMAWIATRDKLALANVRYFSRGDEEDVIIEEGVSWANNRMLGWLHTKVALKHCQCDARLNGGYKFWLHCSCLSSAWEELVKYMGGLSDRIPRLSYESNENVLTMSWPDGADDIQFLRSDILERWPQNAPVKEAPLAALSPKPPANRQLRHDEIIEKARWMLDAQPALSKGSAAASIVADLPPNPKTGKLRDQRHIERIIAELWEK